MINAKYLWSLTRSSWSDAVDASVALFITASCINYLVLGHVPEAASSLSNLMPIITALLFASTWLFLVFFMALKEANSWTPLKKWLWKGFHLVGLLFSCYLLAITAIVPGLPLSNWMCNKAVGWVILAFLSVLAIVIIITGKEIKKSSDSAISK